MDSRRARVCRYLPAVEVVGSPATVRTRLEQLLADTAADELMAIASVPDADARSRSFTLLAELADLPRG